MFAQTSFKASDCNISPENVALLGWCDLNVPHARGKESVASLCKGLAMINETNPTLAASVLILPDFAKDSSPRGLYDEERRVFEELFALNQVVETRFVEMFARESRRAENKSNTRRFGTGRLLCSSTNLDGNSWLGSELAVAGRPLGANESAEGAPTAVLPRTASILIPEAASPVTWHLLARNECVFFCGSLARNECGFCFFVVQLERFCNRSSPCCPVRIMSALLSDYGQAMSSLQRRRDADAWKCSWSQP